MSKSIKFNLLTKKLLSDSVLVEAVNEISEDNILRSPTQYGDKPELGYVLAVGPGRMTDSGVRLPTTVEVGMVVLFNKYLATKFRISGQDYFIIREEDIVAYGKEEDS